MARGAYILGCAGPRLGRDEAAFFRDADPWGFILFARNIEDPDQLRELTGELRGAVGWDAPILIDQEGGRVQRMRAPHWREYLPPLDQMARAGPEAMAIRSQMIALELRAVGIDVNCVPSADLVEEATHPVLRNRLYGSDVETVVQTARAVASGTLAGGCLPVLKHLPGYGRASVDGHLELPRVEADLDDLATREFAPFRALGDIRMGMTAHVVLPAIDPGRPVTVSPDGVRAIRETIGYDGLLMTDDISMEALSGPVAERGAASLAAGCDIVLHCNGEMDDMIEIAALGPMSPGAQSRAAFALEQRRSPDGDEEALAEALARALGDGA